MNIFIAGANGRVASLLLEELLRQGHQVYAGVRNPEKMTLTHANLTTVTLDLHRSSEELAELVKEMDAIYFTAGSRGKDLLQTDAFGAVKLMQAAELSGVKRFILLSSVFANRPEKWSDPNLINITNYNIAKFFADQWLINVTQLDYTIIQPGNLVESEPTELIQTNVDHSQPNSIGNVAKVLAEVLEKENTYQKVITMADGQEPIKSAIERI